jgi:hypothetical protein
MWESLDSSSLDVLEESSSNAVALVEAMEKRQ